jgi:N6-L-threonylcarbamoyladenine synthase
VALLAIESSCDETAVAIYGKSRSSSQGELFASLISSQIDLHKDLGGVVPELASRNHTLALRPLIEKTLATAHLQASDLTAFAATGGPGLASSLQVGHSFAKGLALAANKPFLSINHMEGHLLSPFLGEDTIPPHLALVVSGGHTLLLHTSAVGSYQLLGQTLDDAAGEAFDKVAKMLELPYPGGPEIERHAHEGDATAFDFPRSLLNEDHLDFSFSGLKTAVLYTLQKLPNPRDRIPDLCASFQAAVCDVLIAKTLRAAKNANLSLVTLSGGVSCNSTLRNQLAAACQKEGLTLRASPPSLATDNAAMIAYAAWLKLQNGQTSRLTTDIDPNLKLTSDSFREKR